MEVLVNVNCEFNIVLFGDGVNFEKEDFVFFFIFDNEFYFFFNQGGCVCIFVLEWENNKWIEGEVLCNFLVIQQGYFCNSVMFLDGN